MTFAGDPQHTAQYGVPAQPLSRVRWSTSIDLHNTGADAHYGAPLITASNTVLVPVKTTNGFQVSAFEGATGRFKYTLSSDYILPSYNWIPVYQPVIATPASGDRLYYAGAGGTVYYVGDLDSDTPTAPSQVCFYTNLAGYVSNASAYKTNVFINTAITADTNGVIFFGFRVDGTARAPLSTTNSGFARIDAAGNTRYVLAGDAADDSAIYRDTHNSAPALSRDGSTLYVAVKGPNAYYGYLLGLDTTNLATKYQVLLRDPRSGFFAGVLDDGTASAMVAPDDDVYFGVLGNPGNGSRGFLLRFSADLATEKPPGGFGWDFTPALVPSSMVPGYTGSSSYLLFSKYNNYAADGDGNGINRIALLDPNATQLDAHPSEAGLVQMRELLTVIGPTLDPEYRGPTYPYAVREWCINTAAVNPATASIFTPSEDGHIYRWNLAANALTETVMLGSGVGEPYVPTVVGPDGTVYTLNGGKLFALGGLTNMGMAVYSSAPDVRKVVAGEALTFTVVVTNLNASGPAPTGTVSFRDVTTGTIFGTNIALSNGLAMVTTSALSADSTNLGNHFIAADYSGDVEFPSNSATMVQKVHASASATTLHSASSNAAVTLTVSVVSSPAGGGTPSGQITFWDGTTSIGQTPLNTNGTAVLTVQSYSAASHALSASYASDTLFAASSASATVVAPLLVSPAIQTNGAFALSFTNTVGAPFTVLGASDLSLPVDQWLELGQAVEFLPGQFQFSDLQVTNNPVRFYMVRSP